MAQGRMRFFYATSKGSNGEGVEVDEFEELTGESFDDVNQVAAQTAQRDIYLGSLGADSGSEADAAANFIRDEDDPSPEVLFANTEVNALCGEVLSVIRERLKPKELDILDTRLLSDEPDTLRAIGNRYGVSRERIRQIEETLKRKLRKWMEGFGES